MTTLDRVVIYVGVWLAVILVAVGISRMKKPEPQHFEGGKRLLETNPTVTVGIDNNSNPPSCYSTNPWPRLPASNRSDTVDWTAAQGDMHTYFITFVGTNPLLKNDGTGPATMPIIVSSGGTPEGPYKISSVAVNACQIAGVSPASGCYYSYDISLSNPVPPPGPTCVQHYGGGPGFDMGIQLQR